MGVGLGPPISELREQSGKLRALGVSETRQSRADRLTALTTDAARCLLALFRQHHPGAARIFGVCFAFHEPHLLRLLNETRGARLIHPDRLTNLTDAQRASRSERFEQARAREPGDGSPGTLATTAPECATHAAHCWLPRAPTTVRAGMRVIPRSIARATMRMFVVRTMRAVMHVRPWPAPASNTR